ncbi:hypothetical protein GZH53_17430 [Flavihumibacter sp. R14]|nr:hypothetical protein [Flavihumibacter soli]
MKTLHKPGFAKRGILLCILFFIVQHAQGQARWSVRMTEPGRFVVEITPTKYLEQVECGILLYGQGMAPLKAMIKFTNDDHHTLEPRKTYSKEIGCDRAYTRAKGYLMTGKLWTGSANTQGVTGRSFTIDSDSGGSLTTGPTIKITEPAEGNTKY